MASYAVLLLLLPFWTQSHHHSCQQELSFLSLKWPVHLYPVPRSIIKWLIPSSFGFVQMTFHSELFHDQRIHHDNPPAFPIHPMLLIFSVSFNIWNSCVFILVWFWGHITWQYKLHKGTYFCSFTAASHNNACGILSTQLPLDNKLPV